MDSYVINCVLTNLISQATVTWELGTKVDNLGTLSVDQGTIADQTQTCTDIDKLSTRKS